MNAVVSPRQPAKKASSKPVARKPAAKKVSRPTAKVAKVAKAIKVPQPAPAPKPAAQLAKAAKATKPAKVAKPSAPAAAPVGNGKQKLVRDSFTMPNHDFGLIHSLKERTLGFRRPTKKSELLRAGLHALAALGDTQLRAVLEGLTPLKSGRPKKAG